MKLPIVSKVVKIHKKLLLDDLNFIILAPIFMK